MDTTDASPPAESQAKTTVIYGQLRDFIASHERRRHQMPRAVLVGLLAGLAAVAFRQSLDLIDHWRNEFLNYAHSLLLGLPLVIALCAGGATAAVYLVRRFAPETAGSGIPHVAAVLHRLHTLKWKRVLPVKFFGGILGIGAGMALGREGPTIQMGAAMGQLTSELMKTRPRERRTLIAAGAAAGLAAAFNAPLAGLMFVLELQRDFATGVFTAAFMSAVTADLVARFLMGQEPVYAVPNNEFPSLLATPFFVLLGLICGVLGVAYNRGLLISLRGFERIRSWPAGLTGAVVGVVLGIVGWHFPQMLGDGHNLVKATLRETSPLPTLCTILILRFTLTMLCYGCGAPGGIFAPLLILGADLGRVVGQVANAWVPELGCSPQTFVVVGMAAYFTAIVRAPLTGIVLIVEMTGNYNLMLALLTACLTAYAIADFLGDLPIYEALLQRQMALTEEKAELQDTRSWWRTPYERARLSTGRRSPIWGYPSAASLSPFAAEARNSSPRPQ